MECASELKQIRRSLLEDFEISPSLERSCQSDVVRHCQSVERSDVIHCLMDAARRRHHPPPPAAAEAAAAADDNKPLSPQCYREVCSSSTKCDHTVFHIVVFAIRFITMLV